MMPVDGSLTSSQLELQILSHKGGGGEHALTVGTHFQEVHTYRFILSHETSDNE
jgi:hypothetical protein